MSKAVVRKKYVVVALGVLLVGAVLFSLYLGTKDEAPADGGAEVEAQNDAEAEALAVIERLGGDEDEAVDPEVKIVTPSGDSLLWGQANHFRADVVGRQSGKRCICRWQFYMSQDSDASEELYKTQDTDYANKGCGFTSHVDKAGKLRLKVDMIMKDYDTGEEAVVASDEKNYQVSYES